MKKYLFTLLSLLQATLLMAGTSKVKGTTNNQQAAIKTAVRCLGRTAEGNAAVMQVKPFVIVSALEEGYLPQGKLPNLSGDMVALKKEAPKK
ncbi:hypothetical protein [Adhaeribacter soli]|uniref:Uncharacterized protein n=1 Tax=Adhaeribacter soli TaxID=2607655 RepID=A0A5N1J2T7_9BACT|nr:hypothetical protein [Adhaeribacter soli]KAA9340076.1 hypothetical protein F0P94_06925 [Adhaeribacter soli]